MNRNERILEILRIQKDARLSGQLYHYTQVAMAYNSSHMEGNSLTEEETSFLYETKQIKGTHTLDDVKEVHNHFTLFQYMLDTADEKITPEMMKEYHQILKGGVEYDETHGFPVGKYKAYPNSVGGRTLTPPEEVAEEMDNLLLTYHFQSQKTIKELVEFHFRFELIHPFQDGNGRIGRMLLFKECLRNDVMPLIILDREKDHYYQGLKEYERQPMELLAFCESMQRQYREKYEYFIPGKQPPCN